MPRKICPARHSQTDFVARARVANLHNLVSLNSNNSMNVVILGAGTVGTSIAELLCGKHHNVCLIDESQEALDRVDETVDVQTVCGSACDVTTLFQAGVQSAGLCLSVTSSDEVNLIGASLAKAMGVARSVARIYNPALRDSSTFDYRRHFGIDRLLSLEYLTAIELAKAAQVQGLFAVENFARGGVEVQEVEAQTGCSAVGIPLKELSLPKGVRVGVISGKLRTVIAGADDVIQAGDHVTLIGRSEAIDGVRTLFERKPYPQLNVIIAGGGEVGFHLAHLLETRRFKVVLMEADKARCEELSARLNGTMVLHADVTKQSEMAEARVGQADVFVSCLGRDEDNIVCGVEAKEVGCQRILSVIRRPDYANVLEKLGIDVAVSPREVMADQVRGLVQAGPILERSFISGQDAEVWEVEVQPGSPISLAPLKDISLRHSSIAAFERDDFVRVPLAEDQLKPGDTAIVLVQTTSAHETVALFTKPH